MAADFVSPVNRKPYLLLPTSLHRWKTSASRCGNPAQFHKLVNSLKVLLPFQHLVCLWGYPSHRTIRFISNHGFPEEFLRWYLTKGLLWKGPMFRKWLRTSRTQASADVFGRRRMRVDPEFLQELRKFHVTNMLAGGIRNRRRWIYCVIAMESDETCRAYFKEFESVVLILARALERACPRPLVTRRETTILEHRMMGRIPKEIAEAEGISEGTVREHLQSIKRKLFTNDLVNAVVIAIRSGMLVHRKGGEELLGEPLTAGRTR